MTVEAIPVRWKTAPIRRFCRVFSGATPDRSVAKYWDDGVIPWLASGDVNQRRITSARRFITEAGYAASSTRWVRPKSLVLALAGQGKTKGMVATVEFATTCNQSLAAIEPAETQVDYRFLAYYLESRYLDLRALVGDDLRDGLNLEHVRSIEVPIPSLDEQLGIIRFLDHADRRLRRAIGAKQKLIALLNEKKQAVIHRAVTRGLDQNVRLEPSGVDWLGDVRGDWPVTSLGRLIELTTGFAFKSEMFTRNMTDVRLLRGINVAPGSVRWKAVVRWPAAAAPEFAAFELRPGDIVLGMDRPIISAGVRVALVGDGDVPSLLVQRVARMRPRDGLDRRFALFLLAGKAFADYLAPVFTGISVPHVSPEQIRAFRVPLPPPGQQRLIADYVEDATATVATAIRTTERVIERLREYRTRLIADIVTGKLDVREAAARLPNEADNPEPLDEFDVGESNEPEPEEPEAVEA